MTGKVPADQIDDALFCRMVRIGDQIDRILSFNVKPL
jgi:hypothetical protein